MYVFTSFKKSRGRCDLKGMIARDKMEDWKIEEEQLMGNSCTHKAEQEDRYCQVQGPMPKTPLHPRLEGFREG